MPSVFLFNTIFLNPPLLLTETIIVPSTIPFPVTVWPLTTAAAKGVGLIVLVVNPRVSKPAKVVEPTVAVVITACTPICFEGVFILAIKGLETTL